MTKYQRLLKLACAITLENYDLALRSNPRDQKYLIRDALVLVLLFVLQVVMWSIVLNIVTNEPVIAGGIALMIAFIVLALDQAIGGSASKAEGFLSEDPWWKRMLGRVFPISMRLMVTVPLSIATSLAVTLVLLDGAILNQLHQQKNEINRPLTQEYRDQEAKLEAQLLEPGAQRLVSLENEVKELNRAIRLEADNLKSLRENRDQLKLEQQCQFEGKQLKGCIHDEYEKGDGPIYKEYQRQIDREEASIKDSRDNLQLMQSQMRGLQDQIGRAQESFSNAQARLQEEKRRLAREKADDPRFLESQDGLLLRLQALNELRKAPDSGDMAQMLAFLAMFVLMTLDLSFVIIKLFFPPASVYQLRSTEAARVEARGLRAEFSHQGQDPEHRLRVVARNEDVPVGAQV